MNDMRENHFDLLKNGHSSALVKIHAKYSRRIFWLGKSLIKDDFVIETLVQDVFLKLWIHRETIETPEHIYYFLRFVMKRECISYYTKPKHQFYRKLFSLENFENYNDYLIKADSFSDSEERSRLQTDQEAFDQIIKVLPLLDPDKQRLIHLCLKYGFQYKLISGVMGTSVTQTSNDVKLAIGDIKKIINRSGDNERKKPATQIKLQGEMTKEQKEVLRLRCDMKYSFAAIAEELDLSQKEVQEKFIAAYRLLEEKHQEQLESVYS